MHMHNMHSCERVGIKLEIHQAIINRFMRTDVRLTVNGCYFSAGPIRINLWACLFVYDLRPIWCKCVIQYGASNKRCKCIMTRWVAPGKIEPMQRPAHEEHSFAWVPLRSTQAQFRGFTGIKRSHYFEWKMSKKMWPWSIVLYDTLL